MTITMNTARILTIAEMQSFIVGSAEDQFSASNKQEVYEFLTEVLRAHHYGEQARKNKGVVRKYLQKITGYERAQITRLIGQFVRKKKITPAQVNRPCFVTKYTREDVLLLAETDEAHSVLSGPATLAVMKREFTLFKKPAYERLSILSVSHLYNLRQKFTYREKLQHFTKTTPNKVPLGQRVKPRPQGQPGFIRVDSVHQGDFNGEKGVYYINLVDEVLQWEITVCVEKISEQYMVPALATAMDAFPFEIQNFHADNGSEYINKCVAGLLEQMHVKLTKSRPRHSGDNGLVECKNGAIIRKQLGYAHIPQVNAGRINEWMQKHLNPYLNFHRPCAFPEEKVDGRGKMKKTYPKDHYQIPYEKLKSLPNAEQHLKPGITFAQLDKVAYATSDTEAAKELSLQKQKLFTRLSFPSS
jgi:transposase InsO family protein